LVVFIKLLELGGKQPVMNQEEGSAGEFLGTNWQLNPSGLITVSACFGYSFFGIRGDMDSKLSNSFITFVPLSFIPISLFTFRILRPIFWAQVYNCGGWTVSVIDGKYESKPLLDLSWRDKGDF